MKVLLLTTAMVAAILAGPALAQEHHHHEAEAPDHSAHGGPVEADPHAGHVMPAQEPEADESAADAHSHDGATASEEVEPSPLAAPPPEAFSGPEFAADSIYGETAMALARRSDLETMHGGTTAHKVLIERLEAQVRRGRDAYLFDAQAWYGGDIDKLWLKAEGNGGFGTRLDETELQALWSHAIGPWFDLQTGVRYDLRPGNDLAHLVVGVQGLAPYWIEIEAAAFLSERGDLTATIEAEHDARITQRLILQPRAQVSLAAQDVPRSDLGPGVTGVEAGLRLRYEIVPQFAPYVGVEYRAKLGKTADRARATGEDPSGLSFVAGLRAWF